MLSSMRAFLRDENDWISSYTSSEGMEGGGIIISLRLQQNLEFTKRSNFMLCKTLHLN